MGFLSTTPFGAADANPMNLDTAPSTAAQRQPPLAGVEQVMQFSRWARAQPGYDAETGLQTSAGEPLVPAEDLQKRWSVKGPTPELSLNFTDAMPESVARDRNEAKRAEILRSNAEGASPHTWGSVLGDLGMGFLDPIGLAASALPVFGEARAAALLARAGLSLGEGFAGRTAARAVAGAISAPLANIPAAALRYGLSAQDGTDYSFYDAARDVAYGAPMGAVLHPLGGAIGDLFRPARRPVPVSRFDAPQANAAAVQARDAGAAEDEPADAEDELAEAEDEPAIRAPRDVAYGVRRKAALDAATSAIADRIQPARAPVPVSRFDAPQANAAAVQAATAAVLEDRPVDLTPIAAVSPPLAPRDTYPVFTPGGMRIEARPEVVPLDSLIVSHGPDGTINPAYPAAQQPRDRTSFTSQEQIRAIAAGLEPERLGPSPEAASGAPLVSGADVVASGNGRLAALRLAYDDPALAAQAGHYQQFLRDQGYHIDGIDKPVLIGRIASELNDTQHVELARGANERTTLDMTAAEQARADADRAGRALDLWRGSSVGAAANSDFVRSFIAQLPETERGKLRTGDGTLSADGERRIQAAVMAHAYGDALGPTLGRFLNGDTEGMRGIAGALSDAAAPWGQLRRAAAEGEVPKSLDLTDALGEAVRLVDQARHSGRPLTDFINQTDFDRAPPSAEALALARLFFRDDAMRKPVARDKLAKLLRAYATEARKVQPAPDMFGAAPASAADILHALARGDATREQAALAFAGRREAPESSADEVDQPAAEAPEPGHAAQPEAPRELAAQLADAEQSIAHADAAGLLTEDDRAELARLDTDAAAVQGEQDGIAQAAACIGRGL